MSERWLPVVGWEGYYEVSDMGRVRSVDRTIIRSGRQSGDGRWFYRGKVLSPGINRLGYPLVALSRSSNITSKKVHRLVLEAFVGPCPDGMEACHNDGVRSNAKLTNLRWDTPSANQHDTVRHGHNHRANQTHCIHGHLFDEQNTKRSPARPTIRQCRACHRENERKSRIRKQQLRRTNA
jgi:hypothetical protein